MESLSERMEMIVLERKRDPSVWERRRHGDKGKRRPTWVGPMEHKYPKGKKNKIIRINI